METHPEDGAGSIAHAKKNPGPKNSIRDFPLLSSDKPWDTTPSTQPLPYLLRQVF
jgi:hypothetical protein